MHLEDPYASPRVGDPVADPYAAQHPPGYGYHLKHSGIGITSFVIAIVAGIALPAIVFAAAFLESNQAGGFDESDPKVVLLALGMFAAIGSSFCGLILGVVSVFLPDRKRVFGVLGITFNGMIISGVAALLVTALMG